MQHAAPLLVAASLLVLVACVSGTPPLDAAGPPPDPAFAPALDRAAAGDWDYLRIDAGCRAEPLGWHSTTLFGSGVGIVDERRQFAVPRQHLLALLARFRDIGFATLPATIGGGEGDGPAREIDGGEAPLQAVCVLGLRIGGLGRTVQQLDRGERSERLLAMAGEVLALGDELGADGVTAADLEAGLDGLAAGRLAPETLSLTVNHRDADGDGWLLTVQGGFAWLQPFAAGSGFAETRSRRLPAETVGRLAATLRDERFATLPGNLWDGGYLHVHVDLLRHEHEVLAQRFAGMTAASRPDARERLSRVAAEAKALAAWVLDGD